MDASQILGKIEQLLDKDDWSDQDVISTLFDKINQLTLSDDEYRHYIFLLGRF